MQAANESDQILDLARLRVVALGDEEFERELVDLFLADSEQQVGRLRGAGERQDWPEAAKAAHRIKGAALNIGGHALAAACVELESQAQQDGPALEAVAAVARAHELACRALRERFRPERAAGV